MISGFMGDRINPKKMIFIVIGIVMQGILRDGVHLMLISLVTGHFNKFGNVSWISGLLNFFTYIGSALSTYGIAKVSEIYGWQFTVFCWAIVAIIGTLACFICIRKWEKFRG